MAYELIQQYIRPELAILVAVLYVIGVGLKKSVYVKDELIPYILGAISLALCAIYILAVEPITGGYQRVLILIFDIVIQAVCCAAAAVYFNQLYKQKKKLEESTPESE